MKKLLAALTIAFAGVTALAPPAAADVITEPTHFTVTLEPGVCELTIVNGASVHPNTTVVIHDLETWVQLADLADVEREAGLESSVTFAVPASGKVDVYVIPGSSGISSLDASTFACDPKPEVVEPEPTVPVTSPPVELEEPPPVEEPSPTTTPATTTPPTTPTTPPVEETPTPTQPEPVKETPPAGQPELAHTSVESALTAGLGTLLIAAGGAINWVTRRKVW